MSFAPPIARVLHGFAGYGPDGKYPAGGLDLQLNGDHVRLRPLTPRGEPAGGHQLAVPMRSLEALLRQLRAQYCAWLVDAGGSVDLPEIPAPKARRRRPAPPAGPAPPPASATQFRTLFGHAGYGPDARYPSAGVEVRNAGDHVRLVPLSAAGQPAEAHLLAIPMAALRDVIDQLGHARAAWLADGEGRFMPVRRTAARRKRAAPLPRPLPALAS